MLWVLALITFPIPTILITLGIAGVLFSFAKGLLKWCLRHPVITIVILLIL